MPKEGNSATSSQSTRKSPPFHFHVDDQPFTSDVAVLTGAQIKARASVDPSFGLRMEGHGNDPDRSISDTDSIDLAEPGVERFHTVPPANFGSRA